MHTLNQMEVQDLFPSALTSITSRRSCSQELMFRKLPRVTRCLQLDIIQMFEKNMVITSSTHSDFCIQILNWLSRTCYIAPSYILVAGCSKWTINHSVISSSAPEMFIKFSNGCKRNHTVKWLKLKCESSWESWKFSIILLFFISSACQKRLLWGFLVFS